MEAEQIINAWLEPAISCWYKDQCRLPDNDFYLYYKAGTQQDHGALIIAENPPNTNWHLAHSSPLSGFKTPQQNLAWAKEIANKLPILKRGGGAQPMTNPTTKQETKTIQEWLAPLGGIEKVDCHESYLNVETFAPCLLGMSYGADSRGLLQCCLGGGYAIMKFRPAKNTRRSLYLIHDTSRGEAWFSKIQRGETVHSIGPRPHDRLKIVQSA